MENIVSGPYIVLSDGSTFDDVYDCEIAYLTRFGEEEVIDVQNRGWRPGMGPAAYFDEASPDDVHTIPLIKMIKFYFANHPEEDPMR